MPGLHREAVLIRRQMSFEKEGQPEDKPRNSRGAENFPFCRERGLPFQMISKYSY